MAMNSIKLSYLAYWLKVISNPMFVPNFTLHFYCFKSNFLYCFYKYFSFFFFSLHERIAKTGNFIPRKYNLKKKSEKLKKKISSDTSQLHRSEVQGNPNPRTFEEFRSEHYSSDPQNFLFFFF